ncbi:MAG: LemA family protein [Bacilli bacterium]|nr:LemA family protein [Bacilli bacterium]
MKLWLIILIILVVIFAIFLLVNIIYNKFQDFIIRIKEVEGKIDDTLRDKYDDLLKINNTVKEKINTDKEIVDDLEDIKTDEKSSFEVHRLLKESFNKLDFIKKQYKELNTEDINKLFFDINEMDESLNVYIKYYNENIVEYNKYVRKFPFNIIGIILKYKEKPFFDNKDLNDENIKDFKI